MALYNRLYEWAGGSRSRITNCRVRVGFCELAVFLTYSTPQMYQQTYDTEQCSAKRSSGPSSQQGQHYWIHLQYAFWVIPYYSIYSEHLTSNCCTPSNKDQNIAPWICHNKIHVSVKKLWHHQRPLTWCKCFPHCIENWNLQKVEATLTQNLNSIWFITDRNTQSLPLDLGSRCNYRTRSTDRSATAVLYRNEKEG